MKKTMNRWLCVEFSAVDVVPGWLLAMSKSQMERWIEQ